MDILSLIVLIALGLFLYSLAGWGIGQALGDTGGHYHINKYSTRQRWGIGILWPLIMSIFVLVGIFSGVIYLLRAVADGLRIASDPKTYKE